MCGEELLDEAARQAVVEECDRRLRALFTGLDVPAAPIGLIPEAFRAAPSFTVTYSPACRICATAGRLGCILHGPFRPLPEPVPFRALLTGGMS